MEKIELKYRTWFKGVPPRKIRGEVPGWSGDHKSHRNGDTPQPWHCVPFMEGSCYGLELIYPFDAECRITFDGKDTKFEGDFDAECPWALDGALPVGSPPFMSFAPGHYGFTSSLDLEPPEGYVVRLEPHPRFYTDTTGTVPLAIAGHIQRWWPRIFFVVFKAPWPGQTHIFRKGDPYAKIMLVPQKVDYDVVAMTDKEALKRATRDKIIGQHGNLVARHMFKSDAGYWFDDKYRQLANAYNKGGYFALDEMLETAGKRQTRHGKIVGKFVKPITVK